METVSEKKKKLDIMTWLGAGVVVTLIIGLLLSMSHIAKQQRMYAIATFAQCKAAGYPILESYPEQCVTTDGRIFVNEAQSVQLPADFSATSSEPQAI